MKKLFNVVSLVLMLSMVMTAVVFADYIVNTIDNTIDATVEVVEITAGQSVSVGYYITVNPETDVPDDDPLNGCNAGGGHPVIVTPILPTGVSANPTSISFDACDVIKYVEFTSTTVDDYFIEVGYTGGRTQTTGGPSGGTTYSTNVTSTADFKLVVKAGTPTDTTDPVVNCTVPVDTIWYADNVDVDCTASDAGSGLADPADASFTLSTSVAVDVETATAKTNSREVCDVAGNCVTAGPYTFKVDRKAPAILCTVPNAEIWYADNVTVDCTSSDLGSGLKVAADDSFNLSTTVAADEETSTAQTGSKTVYDNVDNFAVAGPYTFKVDKKAPTFGDCPVGGPFILGSGLQSVGPIEAFDYGSGIDATLSTLTGNVDTSTVGSKNVDFTAYDLVGNSETKTCSYSVIYKFGGFLPPINNDGTSVFKLKSTIPVKFQLTDYYGNLVSDAIANIFIQKLTGTVWGTDDEGLVSTSAATTGNLFRYSEDQYIFNLGTKGLSTGTWRIRVELNDGMMYYVTIGLR